MPDGKTATVTQAGSGNIIVAGLTNGTAYTFTVTATNVIGNSSASAASNSVTPASVPNAPTIGAATPGDTEATIAFTAPANNGGSTITKYEAISSPDGKTGIVNGSGSGSITVTGLTNGKTYTFTVRAFNGVGWGGVSAKSDPVTLLIPPPSVISKTGRVWMKNDLTGGNGGFYTWDQARTACPTGFHLPNKEEWVAELNKFSPKNASGANTALGLKKNGYRYSNGSISSEGVYGYYWSSPASSSTGAYYLSFGSSNAHVGSNGKSVGCSVRCIKD